MNHLSRLRGVLNVLAVLIVLVGMASNATAPEPKKLLFYYNASGLREEAYLDAVKQYERDHPNIEVETEYVLARGGGGNWLDQLLLRLASGKDVPDVYMFEVNRALGLAAEGQFKWLDDLVQQDQDEIGWDDIVPGFVQAVTYKGRVFGLPVFTTIPLFFANKTMFDQAGLMCPGNDWSLQDYLKSCQALTQDLDSDGSPDRYGTHVEVLKWAFPAWMTLFGGSILAKDGSVVLDKPANVEALAYLLQLVSTYRVAPDPYQVSGPESFQAGNVGLWVGYNFRIGDLRGTPPSFDWDVLPFPRGPAGTGNVILGSQIMIDNGTKHPDDAWEFAKHLFSYETMAHVAQKAGSIFGRRSLFADEVYYVQGMPPANWDGVMLSLISARPYPMVKCLNDVRNAVNGAVRQAFQANVPPQTALSNAARQIRALLENE